MVVLAVRSSQLGHAAATPAANLNLITVLSMIVGTAIIRVSLHIGTAVHWPVNDVRSADVH